MKRLRALEPEVMFTGLGDIVTNACGALDHCIAYLERTAAEIAALAAEGLEPPRIVERLFGRESNLREITEGHMSYENLQRPLPGTGEKPT